MTAEIFNNILRQYGESMSRVSAMITKTYDVKCEVLAEDFLADTPHLDTEENAADLASTIQQAIENWFADKDRHPDKGEK